MVLVPTLNLAGEIKKFKGKQFVVRCDQYLMYGVGVNHSIRILSHLTNEGIATMKFASLEELKKCLPKHMSNCELLELQNNNIAWNSYLEAKNRIEKTGIEMLNPYQLELRA